MLITRIMDIMQMEATKSVSVVMATGNNRPQALRNTLLSWSKVTYPIEFILVATNGFDPQIEALAHEFSFISKFVVLRPSADGSRDWARVSRVWTTEGKASHGDYVIIAMADELLGDYDIVQKFINAPTPYRTSVITYFMSPDETVALPSMNWLDNPKVLQDFPDFWTHTTVEGADNIPNIERTGAVYVSHITGAPREHWDYTNWFRMDQNGYLWLDMDVHFREVALDRLCVTLPNACCYHQWHPLLELTAEDRDYGHYTYENEMQARLLEPAIFHKGT